MGLTNWIAELDNWKVFGAAIASVAGALWTASTYVRARRIEALRPFLERQLALYTEAVRVTAQIGTIGHDDPESEAIIRRFWNLHWGELCMVEDKGVESAMEEFGKALDERRDGQLRDLSMKLAHAARRSLAQSWGVRQVLMRPDHDELARAGRGAKRLQ